MLQIGIETVVGAAFRALKGARHGARLLGHPIEGLEQIDDALSPARRQLSIERAQQMGQELGSNQSTATGVAGMPSDGGGDGGDAGLDLIGDGADGGIVEHIHDAIEWLLNL